MLTEQAGVVLLHARGRESKHQAQQGAGRAELVVPGAMRELARQRRLARSAQPPHDKRPWPLGFEPLAQAPFQLRPSLEAPVRRLDVEDTDGHEVQRRLLLDAAFGKRAAVLLLQQLALINEALLSRKSALHNHQVV